MTSARPLQTTLAEIVLVATTILWGITFPIVRWLIDVVGMNPQLVVTLKIGLASLAFLPVAAWRWWVLRRAGLAGDAEAAAQCRMGGLFWYRSWVNAVIIVVAFGAQAAGMEFTTATNSAIITGFNIVLVPLMAPLFGRARPARLVFGAAVLCFLGISLIADLQKLQLPNKGDALTLLCAVAFAVHVIYVAIGTNDHDPILFSWAQLAGAAVIYLVWALWTEVAFDPAVIPWGPILVLAIPCTAVTGMLMFWAQRHVTESHAAIIFSIEPIVGTALGIYFLSEPFGLLIVVGAALVAGGIILARPQAAAGHAAAV